MKREKRVDPTRVAGSHVKMSLKRHIMPPLLGGLMMVAVLGMFNSHYLAGKIFAYTYQAPASAVDDATLSKAPVDPNQPAKILINNIGVDAPVIYDDKLSSEAQFQKALQNGVVHYSGTARPGQTGNVVIFGHSSGQVWAPGNYKFVFTHLEKLNHGDNIFVEYQGVRYIYNVTGKKVVPPTDISVLQPTSENILTLITCTPVGTNKNRLIITAQQIVPKPVSTVDPSEQVPQKTEIDNLPGTINPSLWDTLRTRF